jgi:thymidine phosphorylase
MGGARRKVEDPLDLTCGIEFLPAIGDRIEEGQVLARVYCDRADQAAVAAERIGRALTLAASEVPARDLILGRVE